MYSSEYLRSNCQIYRLFFETSKYNGMKNLAIQNRVLQRDRVLERRVLERYYCIPVSFLNECWEHSQLNSKTSVVLPSSPSSVNMMIANPHQVLPCYLHVVKTGNWAESRLNTGRATGNTESRGTQSQNFIVIDS